MDAHVGSNQHFGNSRIGRAFGTTLGGAFSKVFESFSSLDFSRSSHQSDAGENMIVGVDGVVVDSSLSPVKRYELLYGDMPQDICFGDYDLKQMRLEIANDESNWADCVSSPYFRDMFDAAGNLESWARL